MSSEFNVYKAKWPSFLTETNIPLQDYSKGVKKSVASYEELTAAESVILTQLADNSDEAQVKELTDDLETLQASMAEADEDLLKKIKYYSKNKEKYVGFNEKMAEAKKGTANPSADGTTPAVAAAAPELEQQPAASDTSTAAKPLIEQQQAAPLGNVGVPALSQTSIIAGETATQQQGTLSTEPEKAKTDITNVVVAALAITIGAIIGIKLWKSR